MALLEARGLYKRFGDVSAVAGVDLDVEPGEIFGLVGPDGAGKTTTLRLLVGVLDADEDPDEDLDILGVKFQRAVPDCERLLEPFSSATAGQVTTLQVESIRFGVGDQGTHVKRERRFGTTVTDCLQQGRHLFGWCSEPRRQILHRGFVMNGHASEYHGSGWFDFLRESWQSTQMINHEMAHTIFFLCRICCSPYLHRNHEILLRIGIDSVDQLYFRQRCTVVMLYSGF